MMAVLKLTSHSTDASGNIRITFLWDGVEHTYTFSSNSHICHSGKYLVESVEQCAMVIASYGCESNGTMDLDRALNVTLNVEPRGYAPLTSALWGDPTLVWTKSLL